MIVNHKPEESKIIQRSTESNQNSLYFQRYLTLEKVFFLLAFQCKLQDVTYVCVLSIGQPIHCVNMMVI